VSSHAANALYLPIGSLSVPWQEDGQTLAAFIEWHYDQARGWHKGASVLQHAGAV
jgi:hypothetical protein